MADRWPRLALLDITMPGTGGVDLTQSILAAEDLLVILFSARPREDDVGPALNLGAADYIVKPCSPAELAARIWAPLRRRETPDPLEPYVLGELTIDYAERRVTLAGEPVPLALMEYRLLAELSVHAESVLTCQHLLARVWRDKSKGDIRPVRSTINKLRRRLADDADNPTYIFTEPRVGYRMAVGETAGGA